MSLRNSAMKKNGWRDKNRICRWGSWSCHRVLWWINSHTAQHNPLSTGAGIQMSILSIRLREAMVVSGGVLMIAKDEGG